MKSFRGWFKRSLPARLLLVFFITSVLVTAVVIQLLVKGFSTQWQSNVRPHLVQYLDYVNADIGNPPSTDNADDLARRLPINIYIRGQGMDYTSTGQPLDESDLEFHRNRDDYRRHDRRRKTSELGDHKVMFGEHHDRTVLRAEIGDYQVFYELQHRGKREHRDNVIGKSLLGILLLMALCYLLIRRMLKPVQDIKTGVRRMGQGELDYRVPVRANNDLGELAGSINTMAIDIEQMLDAKRQLLLGVSHELRSPLTRATIATQLLDESTNRDRIREDLAEMETLITEILETERMNSRHSVLNREPVDLEALIQSVLTELSAQQINVIIAPSLDRFELDEARIRLLLRNLISNALKHGGDTQPAPEVRVTVDATNLILSVSDHGPGIAPEHLAQLTEPFYRVDPSRTRSTGGFGVGLYLSKLIAEAHQGELAITSQTGLDNSSGTTVKVRLPLVTKA